MAVRDEHVSHPPRWYANNPVCRLTRHWACGFSLLVPRRRKCHRGSQRRNRGGGGLGETPSDSIRGKPRSLCFKGERTSLGRRERDHLGGSSWRGDGSCRDRRESVAKFQRETRFGISKFSGAKIMASDGIPPRGRMELSENFWWTGGVKTRGDLFIITRGGSFSNNLISCSIIKLVQEWNDTDEKKRLY